MKTSTVKISLLLASMMTSGIAGAQQTNKPFHTTKTITMENNKAIVEKLYTTVLNPRQFELLPGYIADTFEGPGGTGIEGFKNPFLALYNGFPDLHWTLVTLVGEGDKVVARWKWTGTHNGTFRNVPATGKAITGNGVSIYELKNGKIVSVDAHIDRFGILQSLDALPAEVLTVAPLKDQVQFIDKFVVPAKAIAEFQERTTVNRRFIKTLPGFITDAEYSFTDEQGNLHCITVAKWESKEALAKAKEKVQALYREQGFNPGEMLQRLGITMDRGIYTTVSAN